MFWVMRAREISVTVDGAHVSFSVSGGMLNLDGYAVMRRIGRHAVFIN